MRGASGRDFALAELTLVRAGPAGRSSASVRAASALQGLGFRFWGWYSSQFKNNYFTEMCSGSEYTKITAAGGGGVERRGAPERRDLGVRGQGSGVTGEGIGDRGWG